MDRADYQPPYHIVVPLPLHSTIFMIATYTAIYCQRGTSTCTRGTIYVMQAPKFIKLKYIIAYEIFSISGAGERKFYCEYVW